MIRFEDLWPRNCPIKACYSPSRRILVDQDRHRKGANPMRIEEHPKPRLPNYPQTGVGIEAPLALLEHIREEPTVLQGLANRHVVSARQFDRRSLEQLCRQAAHYETTPASRMVPLIGKILVTLFSQPSTRTRLSFESAWYRLGGEVISITDITTTGVAKGESNADVAEMLNHYGDMIVMRHSDSRAVYEMIESLQIPIINAGNGTDEHPTQALADIYTLFKWRPALLDPELPQDKRVRMAIIGDPSRMRTVRSLLIFLSRFAGAFEEVVILSSAAEPFSPGEKEELQSAGLTLRVAHELKQELPKLDAIYINAIVPTDEGYEVSGEGMVLNLDSPLKEGSMIMHPLARGPELDVGLDSSEHNWYFAQARGAVFIRMALLTSIAQPVRQLNPIGLAR